MESAKEFLQRYGELRRRVDSLRERLKEAVAERYGVLDGLLRAPKKDGVKVQGGKEIDSVYAVVQKLIDYHDERINNRLDAVKEAESELREAQAVLDRAGLSEVEKQYVELRFVRGLSAGQVELNMNYSGATCRRIKTAIYHKIERKKEGG